MPLERSNGTPQERLRQQATARSAASPLTPRLAPDASSGKRETSPRRPFVKAASTSRNTSPEKSLETPVRALVSSVVTPRSSARGKPKPGSTVSTPGTSTPGSARPRTAFASPRVAAVQSPADRDSRNPSRLNISQEVAHRGAAVAPSPLAQEAVISSQQDTTIKNAGSMFFHADDAKVQEIAKPAVATQKRGAFFYANGQLEHQRSPPLVRAASPALSVFADQRSLAPAVRTGAASEIGLGARQRVTSPTLSAISLSRSPFILSPVSLSPPGGRPGSPTKTDYINTPHATLNHSRLRDRITTSEPPRTPMPNGLGVTIDDNATAATTPSPRHNKSMSTCTVPQESPSAIRKRSATWSDLKGTPAPPVMKPTMLNSQPKVQPGSPTLSRSDTPASLTSPIISDPMQSPSKELIDFASDARRERKVLDLEISNSSLLAINRTLEREVKKHKAELKRYRRLSRAGRFSVAPGTLADDEADGLPHVDGAFVGRPSSPFQEDVSDMDPSDEDEDSDDESQRSSNGTMTREERQRAKDEAQLRADLRKHRELLLDTARMNRSLQRCLTWTEDLIKDGKKALSHDIASSEVRLGGRVLDADDGSESVSPPLEEASSLDAESAVEDDQAAEGDDFTGVEAFLGMGPWQRPTSGRMSAGSEGTNRDSGVEMEKTVKHNPAIEPMVR